MKKAAKQKPVEPQLTDHEIDYASMLPSRRRALEIEFHEWAKNVGAAADAFNLITWLQDKGMLFGNRKRQLLTEVRDELKQYGWMKTAAKIDEVLKE